MNRMDQIMVEQCSDTNPLIPGGKAAKEAAAVTIRDDTSPGADDRRMQSPLYNSLVIPGPGEELTRQQVFDKANERWDQEHGITQ